MEENEIANALKNLSYELISFREKILKEQDISFINWIMLAYIERRGPQKATDLSRRLGLTKSTITHMVDTMEKKDMVKREYDPNDRRTISIYLSNKGKNMFLKQEKFNKILNSVYKNYDTAHIKIFTNMIQLLTDTIHSFRVEGEKYGE
jgi:DNA-binding MarR family transcriptional regulator